MFRDTLTVLTHRLALAALILLLAAVEGRAVQPYQPVHPDPVLEPWRWRTFPELNGLGLRCLAEDRNGNMWFGIDNGVMRYDGVTWTSYTPTDGLYGAPVNVLLATPDGSVYAGTEMGISRFSEGVWSRVFPPEGDLPWPISSLMEASDRSLWAGTGWGALRLSQNDATVYTLQSTGSALQEIAPYVRLFIVPENVAETRTWFEGPGFLRLWGGYLAIDRGARPEVIRILAPGGPGEAAGLKVGDRILAVDGTPSRGRGIGLSGLVGTSLTLTVQRQGNPEPFDITLTRKQIEGSSRIFQVGDIYEDGEGYMWFGLSFGTIGSSPIFS